MANDTTMTYQVREIRRIFLARTRTGGKGVGYPEKGLLSYEQGQILIGVLGSVDITPLVSSMPVWVPLT